MMTNTSCKRNTNITLVKLVFVICIVMMHCFVPWQFNSYFMKGAYIYVEFFFLLQGFYMKDVLRRLSEEQTERQYICTRLQRFFPIVAIQAIILLIIEMLFFGKTMQDYWHILMGTLCQISFMGMLLPKNILNNGTLWFLSAYIFVGAIVAYLIRSSLYKDGALVICILIYNYLINAHGSIDVWWELDFAGAMQCALPRAFAGISLGYFTRVMYEYLKTVVALQTRGFRIASSLLGGCLTIVSIVMAIFMPHTVYDFVHILLLAIIIILLSLGIRLPIENVAKKIDAISLPLYIWQIVAIRIVSLALELSFKSIGAVLLLDFILCVLWLQLSKRWKLCFRNGG